MPNLADLLVTYVPTDSIPLSLRSYIRGETPVSTWPSVISLTVTYLAILFGIQEAMKERAPLELTALFRAHNLLLSVFSFVLMVLLGEEVALTWRRVGTYGMLCAEEAFTPVSITLIKLATTSLTMALFRESNFTFLYSTSLSITNLSTPYSGFLGKNLFVSYTDSTV